jgi:formate hydrogenlyase transcriptional activator
MENDRSQYLVVMSLSGRANQGDQNFEPILLFGDRGWETNGSLKSAKPFLDFLTALSAVKNRGELQQLIESALPKLFTFHDYSIIFSNDPKSSVINTSSIANDAAFNTWVKPLSSERNSFSTEVVNLPFRKELVNQLLQAGITHVAVTLLHEQLSGYFLLTSKKSDGFSVLDLETFRAVGAAISNALINMKAIDQLCLRASDSCAVLDFSEEIGLVRDRKALATLLEKTVSEFFNTNEYILTIKDEAGHFCWFYLYNMLSPIAQTARFEEVALSPHSLSGRLAGIVFNSIHPVRVDLETEADQATSGPSAAALLRAMDITKLTAMPLRLKEEEIGILWINAENENERLLAGIAPHLAIAITNISSNEKIAVQLQELSRYREQLETENLYLQEEIETTNNYSEIVGASRVMGSLFHMVSQVAGTSSSVLIQGETGTGKELLARAIHSTSPRRDKMMVKINCAALPPNLIESELFGHERGSFTGATERRIGKFELANNSTLFLDEIGELPVDLQVKLLRALQEKEIERVGGSTVIKTNVRIIAATNRDLKQEIKLGNFRSDLFFRLNVFPIFIPPLRDRKEDINLLAMHFLNKHAKKCGKKNLGFSSRAMKQLNAYDWPGNVRELEHLVERSILLTSQPIIHNINLPNTENKEVDTHLKVNRIKTIDEIEREHILYVLRHCKGKVSGIGGAAQALNIPSTTLGSKIKRLGITKEFTSE